MTTLPEVGRQVQLHSDESGDTESGSDADSAESVSDVLMDAIWQCMLQECNDVQSPLENERFFVKVMEKLVAKNIFSVISEDAYNNV